jgi:alpha-1,2-mannosyltransferase
MLHNGEAEPSTQLTTPATQISSSRRLFQVALLLGILSWSGQLIWRLTTISGHPPIDFLVYRGGAKSLIGGHMPYMEQFTSLHLNFTYPPLALFGFVPLALLPIHAAIVSWWLVNSLSLIGLCFLALSSVSSARFSRRIVFAVSLAGVSCLMFEPLRSSVGYGQINFVLMLMITFDLLSPSSRLRGIGVGIASAIKLTPLAFIPGFLMDQDRRSAARSTITVVLLSLVSSLMLYDGAKTFWFHQALNPDHKGAVVGACNQSEYSAIMRIFGVSTSSKVLWVSLATITLLVGYVAARSCYQRGRRLDALVVLTLAELLASPISWSHHWSWIVLLPIFIVLRWKHDRWLSLAALPVLIVAAAFPYHWHDWSWYLHGAGRAAMGFTLTIAGLVLFVALSVNEFWAGYVRRHSIESQSGGALHSYR